MIYCWHAWASYCLNGLIFASMNLTVHASMYFFYTLTAFGYRPTKYAMSVTIGQIIQMIVGTAVTFYIGYHEAFVVHKGFTWSLQTPKWVTNEKYTDLSGECAVNPGNTLLGLLMYFSYLVLFLWYFYKAYLAPRKPGSKSSEKID
jgi:elongation of very long chain fatty acids protein 6